MLGKAFLCSAVLAESGSKSAKIGKGFCLMRLTCLVDNCVIYGSALWGEHGLSFLIETGEGNVLWDTGQSGTVLEHNLQALDLQRVPLTAAALSHAHLDHTGGLSLLLDKHPGLPIYAHRDLFVDRYSRREGVERPIGMPWKRQELEAQASFRLSDAPQEIVSGVWTTGGIHRRPYPQGASPSHMMRKNGKLVPDEYLDDLSLVLHAEGGIVLLCGCCHAGLRNTLATVRERYDEPLLAIIGGTHLAQADDAELGALVETLSAEGTPRLYLNHCTGEGALLALSRAFGQRVARCPVGKVLEF